MYINIVIKKQTIKGVIMNFSKYQTTIFEEAEYGTGHVMINATAGSGKTFTLIEIMKRIKGKAIFVAFNKSIADDLGKKVPSNVDCSTLHSLGLKTIIKNFGYVKVDNRKIDFIMNKYIPTQFNNGMSPKEKALCYKMRESIKKMVSLVKANLIDFKNREEIIKNADYYGIDFETEYISHVSTIVQKSIEWNKYIDFDDMIFFPVYFNMNTIQYNYLFVDECQDLNRSQIQLVMNLIKKPSGRIFAVGDPKQSIYGFRGADIDAMNRIKIALDAKEFPLSICYRCPKSHIAIAQEIVPYIESSDTAIEGLIEQSNPDLFVNCVNQEENHLVISRTNAPLISYALMMLKSGKKATVRGSDIGRDLKNIISNLNAISCSDLLDKISEWENKHLEVLEKRWASEDIKANVTDKADMVRAFAEKSESIADVMNSINKLFSDEISGTVFSSIHKAKGLEADIVYILNPEKLPLVRKNQQPWEYEQELNLKYVAMTRAKQKMVFVSGK
jgi:superfamily I DNA/RNA helicase